MTLRSLILGLYLTAAGCHSPQAPGPATATPLFREAAAETGLVFRHFTGATGQFYLPEIMGPGAAVFDYDGDGDLDVYFTQGVVLEPGKSVPGQPLGNRLFRNELRPSGRLRFADVTQQARVGYAGYGMGIAVGDYDNDGRPDLLVTCLGSIVLYRNSGDGTFADVTGPAGLADALWATSAAFLDYDRDGDLDLFVTHYVDFTVAGNKRCPGLGGELDYCSPAAYRGVPDRLYRNDGHGRFTDVTANSGVGSKPGPGLGVVCADFDGDGWLDIYVANDGAANHLWLNQRNGTFRENAVTAGVAYSMDGKAQAGMGVDAEDFDDDGDTDIFVTNLTAETNSLYVNDGKGLFTDDVVKFGLMPPSLPYTGFGTGWLDYDHDGRLDLFVANGAVKIVESLRGAPYPYHESNQLFHHEGARYRETTAEAGPAFQLSEVSRAAAFGDIDNDGDIDIVLGNNNGPARLLLNEAAEGGSLEVALDGISSNRLGLGALVGVLLPGGKTVWRRARTDGSYLSANDPRVHFGLDGAAKLDGVVVVWPNGKAEKWTGIRPGALVRLREGAGTVWNPR